KTTDYGLRLCQKKDLEGGDSQENKDILFKVLKNQATLAQKETVMLNVGLSLLVAEKVTSLNDGIKLSKEALESGLAYRKFQEVINNHKERSDEHTSELQSRFDIVCRLLLEKKNK